jgi:hypothetical protein
MAQEANNLQDIKNTANILFGRFKSKLPEWTGILNQDVDLVVLYERFGGAGKVAKGFYDLAKAISEAKSKEEEDRIVDKELIVLKEIYLTDEAWKNPRFLLLRMLYCQMLGYLLFF